MSLEKKLSRSTRQVARPVSSTVALLVSALFLFSGCALPQLPGHVLVAPFRPQNVYASGATLPLNLRRVAMLPVSCDQSTPEMVEGREALEPVLRDELQKTRRFEITSIKS